MPYAHNSPSQIKTGHGSCRHDLAEKGQGVTLSHVRVCADGLQLKNRCGLLLVIVQLLGLGGGPALTSALAHGSKKAKLEQQRIPAVAWKSIAEALGKPGTLKPGGVYVVGLPRTDLRVAVADVNLKSALGLTSWVAFKQSDHATMVMGELVLTESEVMPVLTKLQENSIEQTALHDHVLFESPHVMYMHIQAMGNALKIARAIHAALALTNTPFVVPTTGLPPAPDLEIDSGQLDNVLGQRGTINGGVYQLRLPRRERIFEKGIEVPPAMGMTTAINFQPTGQGKAAINGDFMLLPNEVNLVIKLFASHGIAVTAIHSHMLDESPRLIFVHFWANGSTLKLALGLRAALDAITPKPGVIR